MDERLALRLMGKIMNWDEETATREYAWVRLMSRLKFDGYRDYIAGVHFAESLAGWLDQFEENDRPVAYEFVKRRLIYFSPAEIQRLVEQLYPRIVEPRLRELAVFGTKVPSYLVWTDPATDVEFERKRRQTLFIGLSDGARLDLLRRANAGILVNDQVVLATHIDNEKWEDVGSKLREEKLFSGIAEPKFQQIYLIDDFTASGTTFVRPKGASWTGKIWKFWNAIAEARCRMKGAFPLSEDFSLHIHHYISTSVAHKRIVERMEAIEKARKPGEWFSTWEVTQGLLLPDETQLSPTTDPQMWAIMDKYYDHELFEQLRVHLEAAGQTHVRYGYADCALPVVLEHNCPNNSVTLLWAETEGVQGHPMRPLFPRRHRHA